MTSPLPPVLPPMNVPPPPMGVLPGMMPGFGPSGPPIPNTNHMNIGMSYQMPRPPFENGYESGPRGEKYNRGKKPFGPDLNGPGPDDPVMVSNGQMMGPMIMMAPMNYSVPPPFMTPNSGMAPTSSVPSVTTMQPSCGFLNSYFGGENSAVINHGATSAKLVNTEMNSGLSCQNGEVKSTANQNTYNYSQFNGGSDMNFSWPANQFFSQPPPWNYNSIADKAFFQNFNTQNNINPGYNRGFNMLNSPNFKPAVGRDYNQAYSQGQTYMPNNYHNTNQEFDCKPYVKQFNNRKHGGFRSGLKKQNKKQMKRKKISPHYCDTCDRSFSTEEQLTTHKSEHQVCGLEGCKFTANPIVVAKHQEMQHFTGLYRRIGSLYTPEDIAKWRNERKKNFPTPQNIEERRAKQAEMFARGERMNQKNDRFPRRFQGNGHSANNGRPKQRPPLHRKHENRSEDDVPLQCPASSQPPPKQPVDPPKKWKPIFPPVVMVIDEDEMRGGVKPFPGTAALRPSKKSVEESEVAAVKSVKPSPNPQGKFVHALSYLNQYGSSSDESDAECTDGYSTVEIMDQNSRVELEPKLSSVDNLSNKPIAEVAEKHVSYSEEPSSTPGDKKCLNNKKKEALSEDMRQIISEETVVRSVSIGKISPENYSVLNSGDCEAVMKETSENDLKTITEKTITKHHKALGKESSTDDDMAVTRDECEGDSVSTAEQANGGGDNTKVIKEGTVEGDSNLITVEISKEDAQMVTEEVSEDDNEAVIENVTTDRISAVTDETNIDDLKAITEKITEEGAETVPEKTCGYDTEAVTEGVVEEVAKSIMEEITAEDASVVTEGITEEDTKAAREDIIEEGVMTVTEDTSKDHFMTMIADTPANVHYSETMDTFMAAESFGTVSSDDSNITETYKSEMVDSETKSDNSYFRRKSLKIVATGDESRREKINMSTGHVRSNTEGLQTSSGSSRSVTDELKTDIDSENVVTEEYKTATNSISMPLPQSKKSVSNEVRDSDDSAPEEISIIKNKNIDSRGTPISSRPSEGNVFNETEDSDGDSDEACDGGHDNRPVAGSSNLRKRKRPCRQNAKKLKTGVDEKQKTENKIPQQSQNGNNRGHFESNQRPRPQPYPVRHRPTLLEKLLSKEVCHERNIILQCVRYVVENNFFDQDSSKSSGEPR